MIESINVKLGGTVLTCTVEELKAFQIELNKLFPSVMNEYVNLPPAMPFEWQHIGYRKAQFNSDGMSLTTNYAGIIPLKQNEV